MQVTAMSTSDPPDRAEQPDHAERRKPQVRRLISFDWPAARRPPAAARRPPPPAAEGLGVPAQIGARRGPRGPQFDVVVTPRTGDVAESHRRRLGDGAAEGQRTRRPGRSSDSVSQDQPTTGSNSSPSCSGSRRACTKQTSRNVPSHIVLPVRVVQQDQPSRRCRARRDPRRGRPASASTLNAQRVRGQPGRRVEGGDEQLRAGPHGAQRGDRLPELRWWSGRVGHERGL